MIPPFDDKGCLPPGIHAATLDEIEARFGRGSEVRQAQIESIRWMIDIALRAGVRRIVLNGSFVTDIIEPNDVDCALLIGPDFPADSGAEAELEKGLPFLEMKVVLHRVFQEYLTETFASDRVGNPKGMIEVVL